MVAHEIVPQSADDAADAVFRSVEAALRFAFGNRHRGSPDTLARYLKSAMGGAPRFDDEIERAAWAGDIRRRIDMVPPLSRALLITRFAPKAFPCACRRACCSGWRTNEEWANAAGEVTQRTPEAVPGTLLQRQLCRGVVLRWAKAEKVNIGLLADKCGVHRNTAGRQAKAITKWLDAGLSLAVERAHGAIRGERP